MMQVYSIYESGGSYDDYYHHEVFTFSTYERAEEVLNKFCKYLEVDICDNNEKPTGDKHSWYEHKTKTDWDGCHVSWEIVTLDIDESVVGSETDYLKK